MKVSDHSMGITPILIRRAAYYALLGIGEYITTHPHFDKVVVSQLYEVTPNPANNGEWSFGIKIQFFYQGRCVRWVEFSSRLTGAGGDSILKKVEDNEELSSNA